jgi:hypothetical protein
MRVAPLPLIALLSLSCDAEPRSPPDTPAYTPADDEGSFCELQLVYAASPADCDSCCWFTGEEECVAAYGDLSCSLEWVDPCDAETSPLPP